jgi:hypothetical protein
MTCQLSSTDKSANITLSNGNLTATAISTAWKSARAVPEAARSFGKWYFEVTVDNNVTATMIGIGLKAASVDSYVGAANGMSYRDSGLRYINASGVAYGDAYGIGDVIGVAYDLDAQLLWFSINGVWQASGDPANGTNGISIPFTTGLAI